jgi:hypothetical protein
MLILLLGAVVSRKKIPVLLRSYRLFLRFWCNTNVIYIICQYFINLTVVNADGIKQIVQ